MIQKPINFAHFGKLYAENQEKAVWLSAKEFVGQNIGVIGVTKNKGVVKMENQLVNFWDVHGLGFVICMFFFPRLTLFFATVWGGFLWWLGLIFVPRLMVAILATLTYWTTNP